MRQHVDRRIEQHRAADKLRVRGLELEHEAPAEGVADPVGLADPERVRRLDEVGDVRLERPGWLPRRAAVPAQVGRDDAELHGPALLCEPAEPLAVAGDAVQADERRRVRVAPLVRVQSHSIVSSPLPDGL